MDRGHFEREITVRLFQASNTLQTYLDKTLKSDNLTSKQFFMMIIIGSFGFDPKISEIADRFGTSHQNVKQVLLKLSRGGFIELYKDESDFRILRTRFTKQAQSFWGNRNMEDEKTMNELYSALSLEELVVFSKSLKKTIQQIEELRK